MAENSEDVIPRSVELDARLTAVANSLRKLGDHIDDPEILIEHSKKVETLVHGLLNGWRDSILEAAADFRPIYNMLMEQVRLRYDFMAVELSPEQIKQIIDEWIKEHA